MKITDTKLPPGVILKQQLEQLPHDEVFTGSELEALIKVCTASIRRLVREIPNNVVRLGTVNYYGCAKAIKAFKTHHKLP